MTEVATGEVGRGYSVWKKKENLNFCYTVKKYIYAGQKLFGWVKTVTLYSIKKFNVNGV